MPLPVRSDDMILRLIKEVNDIRSMLRRTVANLPLFDIANENTPAMITANQDNYVPGNFDILRLASDAARTITGIRGGAKGRSLRIYNVGNYEITLQHLGLSSSHGNRIVSPTGFDIILNVGGEITLYYDATILHWISSYATNADHISCQLRLLNDLTVLDSVSTYIPWESRVVDTGGFWSNLSPTYITIPETGWYDLNMQVVWIDTEANSYLYLRSAALVNSAGYFYCADSRMPFDVNIYVLMQNLNRSGIYLTKGTRFRAVLFAVTGASGQTLIKASRSWFSGTVYTELNVVKR